MPTLATKSNQITLTIAYNGTDTLTVTNIEPANAGLEENFTSPVPLKIDWISESDEPMTATLIFTSHEIENQESTGVSILKPALNKREVSLPEGTDKGSCSIWLRDQILGAETSASSGGEISRPMGLQAESSASSGGGIHRPVGPLAGTSKPDWSPTGSGAQVILLPRREGSMPTGQIEPPRPNRRGT